MPGIASLASSFAQLLPDKTAKAYLIELDENDSPASAFAFQYFPESISDSKNINYQQKDIPGGSLPLYQWISSGERLISFAAVFSTDVDLGTDSSGTGKAKSQGLVQRLKAAGVASRNADIRAAIAWLRRYMLPTYDKQKTRGPSKLRLSIPGSGLGVAGGVVRGGALDDTIICVMTQCEATIDAFFPSGLPRFATVQLAFAQIPQMNGQVEFPARTDQMDLYVDGPMSNSFGYNFKVDNTTGAFKK
jgi:hypothetical protein